jgi:hypothetical protein
MPLLTGKKIEQKPKSYKDIKDDIILLMERFKYPSGNVLLRYGDGNLSREICIKRTDRDHGLILYDESTEYLEYLKKNGDIKKGFGDRCTWKFIKRLEAGEISQEKITPEALLVWKYDNDKSS